MTTRKKRVPLSGKAYFDTKSNDRNTRRDALDDYAGNVMAACEELRFAVEANDVEEARTVLFDILAWVTSLQDNLP